MCFFGKVNTMKNNKENLRCWLVLLGLILVQGGTIGIFTNCLGILMSAIRQDLGFRAGDLSVYYLIRNICGGFAVGYTTKYYFRQKGKYARITLTILGLLMGGSCAVMALFSKLWQWYAAAFTAGLGSSATTVIIPIILRNWFRRRTGFAIGTAMSASGVFGAVFSPISSSLITAYGWRTASVIIGIIGSLMIIIPALFLIEISPENVGLKPYGYDEAGSEEKRTMTHTDAVLPVSVFIACVVAILGTSSIVQFSNQIPVFAESVGYTLAFGATLTSITMIGNLSGKLLLGALTDRFGIYSSARIFLVAIISALVVMIVGSKSPVLLSAAMIFYGFAYSIAATGPGLLFPDIYGSSNYQDKLKRYSSISFFFNAFLSVVFPYIYDFTGSFNAVFMYGIIMGMAAFVIFTRLKKYSLSAK